MFRKRFREDSSFWAKKRRGVQSHGTRLWAEERKRIRSNLQTLLSEDRKGNNDCCQTVGRRGAAECKPLAHSISEDNRSRRAKRGDCPGRGSEEICCIEKIKSCPGGRGTRVGGR